MFKTVLEVNVYCDMVLMKPLAGLCTSPDANNMLKILTHKPSQSCGLLLNSVRPAPASQCLDLTPEPYLVKNQERLW